MLPSSRSCPQHEVRAVRQAPRGTRKGDRPMKKAIASLIVVAAAVAVSAGQAERRAYNIISEAHQELESAIEDLRKLDPNNEELPTMEDYLKHME